MQVNLTSSTNELVYWFQMEFPHLVNQMNSSTHHYDAQTLNPYHVEGSVWTHSMMVCLMANHIAPENHHVRWSSLLHDIGKPAARQVNDTNKRASFYGHEGLSSYMAIDILNRVEMPVYDKILITQIIATHGDLFHYINIDGSIKNDIFANFKGNRQLLENLVYQVAADSQGRFWSAGHVTNLNKDLPLQFKPIIDKLTYDVVPMKNTGAPKLTILVGPPCSGKSSYLAKHFAETQIISRDDLVQAFGIARGMNYSEAFRFLMDNKTVCKDEIDNVLNAQALEARNRNASVVIDMTSMSKKSRRKWINEFSKYDKSAIVFLTGLEELNRRNKIRATATGKNIPPHVLQDMCLKYSMPTYAEGFNSIEFIWDGKFAWVH